jgi:hypothetical protein
MQDLSREAVRGFLRSYAWLPSESQRDKDMVVECIMMQGGYEFLDARADRFAGAQWEPGPEAFDEGVMFEMTALYECHDGPHIVACPQYKEST